jgi:hypothetical protein
MNNPSNYRPLFTWEGVVPHLFLDDPKAFNFYFAAGLDKAGSGALSVARKL